MNKSKFDKLFEPGRIGLMELKNRIVMPPMTTLFADGNGGVTDRLIAYYTERAKGGAGLIIVEAAVVEWPRGKLVLNSLNISDEKYIPGLSQIARAVQSYGAKVGLQIAHAGRQTNLANTEGLTPVSASDFPGANFKVQGLTEDEIPIIIEKFSESARRAKKAGFDAVEIHGAHGYLIASFLSPYTNKRLDKYGGNIENRTNFAIEVVKRTREKVGTDYPLLFRISGEERVEGGLTLPDTKTIARQLELAGIDALDVSIGIRESAKWTHAPMAIPPAYQSYLAENIKQSVKIPVITIGRINDPNIAESLLESGKADFTAMGRALIADPYLPKKALSGRLNDIRKCIACCHGCIGNLLSKDWPIECDINPSVGREREFDLRKTAEAKKVLVIGGGPAGIEAAHIAAARGHKVTLCEKNKKLGGQLILAAIPPHKEEIKNYIEYLIHQIDNDDVEVHLGVDVTVELVQHEKPEAVILAVGASPFIPHIPGIEKENVITAWDILEGKVQVKGDKIIVIGGGTVGCETAEFLADRGKKVIILEMLDEIAFDMPLRPKAFMLERLDEKKVQIFTGFKASKITDKGVTATGKDKIEKLFEGDMAVFATGVISNKFLFEKLRGQIRELHVVGDCNNPGRILDAVREGAFTALQV